MQFSKIIDEKNPSTPFLLLKIYKKIQNHTQTFHTFKMGESNSSPLSIDTPPHKSRHCEPARRLVRQSVLPPSPTASRFSFSTSFPHKKKERPQPLLKSYEIFYRWDTNVLFTATVRLISEDLMLAKIVRMMVSAFLPLTSGSRSCSRASTNSSMTPERVVGSKL